MNLAKKKEKKSNYCSLSTYYVPSTEGKGTYALPHLLTPLLRAHMKARNCILAHLQSEGRTMGKHMH